MLFNINNTGNRAFGQMIPNLKFGDMCDFSKNVLKLKKVISAVAINGIIQNSVMKNCYEEEEILTFRLLTEVSGSVCQLEEFGSINLVVRVRFSLFSDK